MEAILMSEMPINQSKLPFFFLICYNSPKTRNQNIPIPKFPWIYICIFAMLYRFSAVDKIIKQNCFRLTLGLREVGISLYYHIKMPLVEPRK